MHDFTDKSGILRFMAIAFVAGYVLQIGCIATGLLNINHMSFFQWILLGVIFYIPAFAAFAAQLTGKQDDGAGNPLKLLVWPVPLRPALAAAIAIPALFAVIYATAALSGLQEPDFNMHEAIANLRALSPQPLPDNTLGTVGYLMLAVGFPASIVLGATLFALAAFGQEYGWRGYLLPRLLPAGRLKAAIISGLLAYAWFLPLIISGHGGFANAHYFWIALLRILLFFLAGGVILTECHARYGNVGLASIITGAFIGQHWSGIWSYLFPFEFTEFNILVSGPFGAIGIAVWLIIAGLLYLAGQRAEARSAKG